ncbi:MAG TPA: HAD-IA family hydrolase [Prevotella sp.]
MDKKTKIKLVVFDFDGTLADTQTVIVDTMMGVIAELGLEQRSREQCAAMIGLPLSETFATLMPLTNEMNRRCAETYERIFRENNKPGAVKLFPHVLETLTALHQKGITLTIASSRGRQSLLRFVDDFELNGIITYVLGADDVAQAKPHPEPVLKTLRELHFAPQETLVVGDTVFDIQMGQRAQAHTCGVTFGNGKRADMEQIHTEHIIDRFSDLLGLVD